MRAKTFRVRFVISMDFCCYPIYGSMLIMAEDLADAQSKSHEIAKENNWTLSNIDEEYP